MLLFEFILKRKLLKTAMNQIKKYYSLLSINNQNYIESLYMVRRKWKSIKYLGNAVYFQNRTRYKNNVLTLSYQTRKPYVRTARV